MRDQINRNNVIAEENVNLTGHPGTEKYQRWTVEIHDRTDDITSDTDCPCKEQMSEEEREKRIEAIDEVIKEDLDRL